MSVVARLVAVVAFAAGALATTGCGADYDHTEITNVKGSLPFQGTMNYARVVVPVGMVVTAHIVSYDSDHKIMDMGFHATDSNVVDVEGVVSANDFAFFGLSPGTSDVEMTAGGKVVLIVTAVVVDQPSPP